MSGLQNLSEARFDLAVFDEAHKLSWADGRRLDTKTRRYRLAETLAKSTHLLLLTATPHMGKPFPYFALWRLLDCEHFLDAGCAGRGGQEKRRPFFIRRLKEEMVDYQRAADLQAAAVSDREVRVVRAGAGFLRRNRRNTCAGASRRTGRLNRNAAAMVVAVLQRRLASSTYAMVQSLKRRRERIVSGAPPESLPNPERLLELLDTATADESEPTETGTESQERVEEQALALARPQTEKQQETELRYLDATIGQGEAILRQASARRSSSSCVNWWTRRSSSTSGC